MTEVKLYFPKQGKDYKELSRNIRSHTLFRDFVTFKSRDRRYLTLDFKTEERYNILKPLLANTIESLGYVAQEFEPRDDNSDLQ